MNEPFIADREGKKLCVGITQRAFHLIAMVLPKGPNFEVDEEVQFWISSDRNAVAMIYRNGADFGFYVIRRRIDACWVLTADENGFTDPELAADAMCDAMKIGSAREQIPSGARRRQPLFREPGKGTFKILADGGVNFPARWTVEELYLALPNPDANFASSMRNQCEARMWELYLFACFREQGILVSQEHPSPDFFIENAGACSYVEAVTAHAADTHEGGYAPPTFAPKAPEERMAGTAAVRFAKTLYSKLQRHYESSPHVAGHPFALALADYHAPSSMVWSREALPTYLYGSYAITTETPTGPIAQGQPISQLLGRDKIAAGIFRDPNYSHLSAIIFSNAATISKFNRMGFLAGARPPGLTIVRKGLIYDRRPGVLKPIEFEDDILSADYNALWPGGEKWCQELEVFHNPLAKNPFFHDLLPGAAHWFEKDGEIVCEAFWENTFLSSVTKLLIS